MYRFERFELGGKMTTVEWLYIYTFGWKVYIDNDNMYIQSVYIQAMCVSVIL